MPLCMWRSAGGITKNKKQMWACAGLGVPSRGVQGVWGWGWGVVSCLLFYCSSRFCENPRLRSPDLEALATILYFCVRAKLLQLS